MSLLRKLTTKPVWWWETKRAYPIREQWRNLPVLKADQGATPFAILVTPGTFVDALWSGWSWLRFLQAQVRLTIYVDGEITDTMRHDVEALLPGAGLKEVRSTINNATWPPALTAYIGKQPLGRKLALLLFLQAQESLLFCDADVLAFNPPVEVAVAITQGKASYMEEAHAGSFDGNIVEQAKALGINPARGFNSGLLYIPQHSLSAELADQLLQAEPRGEGMWFTEQTVLAVLMQKAGALPLPTERYVISLARQFYWETDSDYATIAARHFSGPTRHVMYGKALPQLLRAGSDK